MENAIELGEKSEGKLGYRGREDMEFYVGYCRDLDGNKISAFHYRPKNA
ncbi:hypothetical protein [Kordiimonas sp.]